VAKRHRMTPKRKAALRKAQAASARKRRKGRNRKIAIGAGIVGTVGIATVAGLAGRDYVKHLRRPYRPSSFMPTHQLALPPGQTVTKVKKVKRGVHHRKGVFKVDSSGTATYIKRNRPNYDWHRRKGFVKGYEKKVRSKYDGLSPRTQRRRNKNRG
jgi:hypothetical protein